VINGCPECLRKQREIDSLKEENQRLKERLRYRERRDKEGFFGSSTPSAKLLLKANTPETPNGKPRGARPGHRGAGRKAPSVSEADYVVDVRAEVADHCPQCGSPLREKGCDERLVLDSRPLQAERVIYRLPKHYCPHCRRTFQPSAPGTLPKSLYGNQLIATASVMHYLHGIPMGRLCEQIGMGPGTMVEIFHRLSRLFGQVPPRLIQQFRESPARHADETGWRTDGKNGYAWLFATEKISIFLFRKTRSSKVPHAVLGERPLPGVLVVDRYAGYNKMPCALQYCYAHLLREVQDLEKEFPDSAEVKAFVSVMAPLLSTAMSLRHQLIKDPQYYARANEIKTQITTVVQTPAAHLGIRRIQDIFHENAHRLYHWVDDRRVPAENNLAERDLRPTVIARKVSFGSASDAGAHTRGVLMTVLHSLKKRNIDAAKHLKTVLDQLAKNIHQDPFPLLFPDTPPS